MRYYSLNHKAPVVDFKEATIRGQAPDKGLYFPETIPSISKELINGIEKLSNEEIAYRVIKPYVADVIPDDKLSEIVRETINFPMPLEQITEDIYALELFHGPTLAFKDVGARFMSRCLGYFSEGRSEKVTILVATSGDTGGAVANGFFGVQGVQVVILYPSGKVSSVQEKQLTTLGRNIHTLEVKGNFDDCQRMVKQAFADEVLKKKMFLTSANSINVARWLPQQFYYFFAYKQWKEKDNLPVVSVPSGNFGNICAGMLAYLSGLPIKHFIAACNVNDVVQLYLKTGEYNPKKAIATLSNAMDVGDPSNFVRVLELFGKDFLKLTEALSSFSITDKETTDTIRKVYEESAYLLDPHGAVGFHSLERYLAIHPGNKGIFLETAHPVKFPGSVEKATNTTIAPPASVAGLLNKEKKATLINPSYPELKDFLLLENI